MLVRSSKDRQETVKFERFLCRSFGHCTNENCHFLVKKGLCGSRYHVVVPVLRDHPFCQAEVVCQDSRWSFKQKQEMQLKI